MGLTKELGELWERQICFMGWRLGAGLGMASRMSAVEMREGREYSQQRKWRRQSHGLGNSGTFKARGAILGRIGFAVEYGDRLSEGQGA